MMPFDPKDGIWEYLYDQGLWGNSPVKPKGVCRVCELLDNDKSKKVVNYCYICNALLCEPCEKNWLRRGKAALKEWVKEKQRQI